MLAKLYSNLYHFKSDIDLNSNKYFDLSIN